GQAPTTKDERRRGAGIGLLAGALVLGAVGGLGGAAVYDAVSDDPATSASTTSGTPRQSSNTASVTPLEPMGSVQEVAASVLPSVVKINVRGGSEGRPEAGAGSGSGIVLSEDGEI